MFIYILRKTVTNATLMSKGRYVKYLCNYKALLFTYFLKAPRGLSSSTKLNFCKNDILRCSRELSTCANQKEHLVSISESRRFMTDCFKAFDVPQNHAEQQADLLVAADYRGHFSHGLNRLEHYLHYLNDVSTKSTDGGAVPKILKESSATAWVDGCNGLGAIWQLAIGNLT
uniref:Malate dehydrogenase n=1 Tax=Glossina brevipalpis TaxID=37001 RepID=A0A1A9WHK2_9MUSC